MLPSTWIGRGITLTWDIHILAAAYNADITVIIKHIMLQWLAQIFLSFETKSIKVSRRVNHINPFVKE